MDLKRLGYFARVADLDRDHVVATGELEHGLPPVHRPAKVRDEHDERSLARERVGPADRLAERGRADASVGRRRRGEGNRGWREIDDVNRLTAGIGRPAPIPRAT